MATDTHPTQEQEAHDAMKQTLIWVGVVFVAVAALVYFAS